MTSKKNLFFPFEPQEKSDSNTESEQEQEEREDGYMPLKNDWYDLPGGQYYIFFEKNRRFRKEG